MKHGLFILMMCLFFSPAKADFNTADKNMHAGVSYNLTAMSYHTYQKLGLSGGHSRWASAVTSLALGAFKEYAYDGRPDSEDMQANLIGTALGIIVPLRIEF